MEYTTNFRRNLILYWQQFYPDYKIPKGYHVHHIKPRCTFEDKDDPRMHHPRNLIALHPDDHATIHKCRGDKWANDSFLKVLGSRLNLGMLGKHHSVESKLQMSKKLKGKKLSPTNALKRKGAGNPFFGKKHSAETLAKMSKSSIGKGKGKIVSAETREKLAATKRGVKRKPFTDEHKAKISASMKGRKRGPFTAEHKAAISAAATARWQNK